MKGASKSCEYLLGYPTIITPKRWHAADALNDCGVARTVRTTPEKYLVYCGMVRCATHGMVMSGAVGQLPRPVPACAGRPPEACVRRTATGGRVGHQVRSADLDEAVWTGFTQRFALWAEHYMGPAQRMAAASEQRLEQVARRRVAIEQPLDALGERDRVPPAPGTPDAHRPRPRWTPASRR